MFEKLNEYWKNYGMEYLTIASIIIIIVLFIFNSFSNEKGTYSNVKFINAPSSFGLGSKMPTEYAEHTPKDSKLEIKAKFILENIFRRPFVKIRPDFLRNDVTGYNLEIDLYNEDLRLGVEINGDQHYKFIPFFHRNKDAFRSQQYRDEMKKVKCRNEGITLIEVPYKVGEDGLKPYLVEKLRLEGFIF
jgi:hypothetical protein